MEITSSTSLLGLVILILDIIVIIQVLTSTRSVSYKLIWTLIVLFLPVVGLILYFFLGKKA